MLRERRRTIVLVLVELLFTAGVIPLAMFFSPEPAVPIHVTLGIFLLRSRKPSLLRLAANRYLL